MPHTRSLIYLEVRHDLAHRIASGAYPAGHELPGVRELCRIYGASHITVSHALRLLSDEHLIRLRRGRPARVLSGNGGECASGRPRNRALRIALMSFSTAPNGVFAYEDGPCSWLKFQYLIKLLRNAGHVPVPFSMRYDWRTALERLDGAILFWNNRMDFPGVYRELLGHGKPFVLLSDCGVGFPGNSVLLNWRPAYAQLGAYFIASGVRKVLVLPFAGQELPLGFNAEAPDFRDMLQDHGLAPEDFTVLPCPDFKTPAPELPEVICRLAGEGPLGIYAMGDLLARRAVTSAREAGLVLKKDLVVVGGSGLPESMTDAPTISTVSPSYWKQAMEAQNMLFEQLQSGVITQPNRVLTARLVIRKS